MYPPIPTSDVRCLTICSPFAALIVDGRKPIENRHTRTIYRGEVLIHASLRRSWGDQSAAYWSKRFDVDPNGLRFGAIIGVAELVDCVALAELAQRHPQLADSPHAFGPWCWILRNALPLRDPIPMRGKLGLYRPDPFTAARFARERPQACEGSTDQRAEVLSCG